MRLFSTLFIALTISPVTALDYTLDLRAAKHWKVDVCDSNQEDIKINFPQKLQAYIKVHAKNSSCLTYSLDIEKVIEKNAGYVKQYSQTLVSQTHRWLLLPENTRAKDTINLKVLYDKQQSISTPWREFSEKGSYQTQAKNFDWPNVFVLGDLKNYSYATESNQQALISFSGGISNDNSKRLLPWLTNALDATHNLYHRFPQNKIQLVILPAERGNEPTPFAQVLRGADSSVIFYVKQDYSLDDFMQDWTAYHELSHLLIPFIRRDEAWVSEGLASYLQYYSMAKHQIISSKSFWRKLNAGFKRGLASHQKNAELTLKQATPRMFQTGAVRRVYWTGAIIFFEIDLLLREHHNTTLLSQLDRFNQKHMPSYRIWSAQEFALAMDKLNPSSFFSEQFHFWANSKNYPDYTSSFKRLGIQISNQGLRFENTLGSELSWQNFIEQGPIQAAGKH